MLNFARRTLVGIGLSWVGFMPGSSLQAADISAVSGLLQTEKTKTDGDSGGSQTDLTVGARLGDRIDAREGWYAEAMLDVHTYDSGDQVSAPDNFTGISLGGGYRYYLTELGKQITPYLAAGGGFMNDRQVELSPKSYEATTDSGLYYQGLLGIRFDADKLFFFELESQLFRSYLFATHKVETVTGKGDAKTSSKTETTRTGLYAKTTGALSSVDVVVGIRF